MFIQLHCMFFPFHGKFPDVSWFLRLKVFQKLESNVLGNVVNGDLISMGS